MSPLSTVLLLCGLLVDYCDVFISSLNTHSDGTHSLQRIHWWASDIMLNFFKSVMMKKQTHLNLKPKTHCTSCLPLGYDVLFFYRDMHRIVRVNRCHYRTVYTHIVAKFIRSMSHSVTRSDLIGLLKLCSVLGLALDGLRLSTFSDLFYFWVSYSFKSDSCWTCYCCCSLGKRAIIH